MGYVINTLLQTQNYLIKKQLQKKSPPRKPPSFALIAIFITFIAYLLGFKINLMVFEQKTTLSYLASVITNIET